jgi:hypothetical protein
MGHYCQPAVLQIISKSKANIRIKFFQVGKMADLTVKLRIFCSPALQRHYKFGEPIARTQRIITFFINLCINLSNDTSNKWLQPKRCGCNYKNLNSMTSWRKSTFVPHAIIRYPILMNFNLVASPVYVFVIVMKYAAAGN